MKKAVTFTLESQKMKKTKGQIEAEICEAVIS